MGNLLGNLLALAITVVLTIITVTSSVQVGSVAFAITAYSIWFLLFVVDFATKPPHGIPLSRLLSESEFEFYRTYHTYLFAPGAGQAFSALLNFLRLAGIVWAGLAFWKGSLWIGGALIAYIFIVGSACLRFDPITYFSRPAAAGNEIAIENLQMLQSVQKKRASYNSDDLQRR
ncbi:hypothetical protein [Hahella chejuensis]|uniref:hypothetical protein n=1 Tax=Hahella chejuensis TaxID=158327 RepID=UPI0005A0172F|nr:hypothetical protein [Hahella chejuensis]